MIYNVSLISNFVWKFNERIVAQVITFVVAVLLARFVHPNDFGLVAFVLVFINIANVVTTMGFSTALIQKKDADELDFSSVFWVNLVVSVVFVFIIWIFVDDFAIYFNNLQIIPVFKVLSFRILLSAFNSVQHAYVSRNLQFKKYFFSTLFGSIISAIVGITLALYGYGVWAIVSQYIVNTTVDTIVLLFTVDWKPKFLFSFLRIKSLFSFGWKILADSIFGAVQLNIRSFVIGKIYSNEALSYFTNSQRIINLLMVNISTSISSVLLPSMSNFNDNKGIVLNFLRKSTKISAYVLFPILVGTFLVAKEFIIVVLTDKWIDMIPYLKIFCLIGLTQVLMPTRNEALKSIGRSDVFLKENTIVRVIDLILLFIFIMRGPLIILVFSLVTNIISIIIIMVNSKIYNGYKILTQFIDLKNTLFNCLIMTMILKSIEILNFNNLIMLVMKIFVGMFIYIILSIIFKFEEFFVILNLTKKIFCKNINLNIL